MLQIQLSFLYVGHTHEDVDQVFSTITDRLKYKEVQTFPQLLRILPNALELRGLFDIKKWIEKYIIDLKDHSKPGSFRFKRNIKCPDKIDLFYRKNSNHAWRLLPSGMFRAHTTGKIMRPSGQPDVLLPDFDTKTINVDEKFKKLEIWKNYFADRLGKTEYNYWKLKFEEFRKNIQSDANRRIYASTGAVWHLPNIPLCEEPRPAVEPVVDEEIETMLETEQQNPEVCI